MSSLPVDQRLPVPKAGAIIVRPGADELEVLLVFRGRKHQDWTFPKGHCEVGETWEETALREVREETGLDIELEKRLPDLMYVSLKENECVAAMFLARVTASSPPARPEQADDRVEWFPLSQVREQLTHLDSRKYFDLIFELIKDAA